MTTTQKKRLSKDLSDPDYQQLLKDNKKALATIVRLLNAQSGNLLRSWLQTFDKDMDLCVSFEEFCDGMVKLEYRGDANELFKALDLDRAKQVTLEEVDLPGAKLWMRFRMWCASQFDDPRDMLFKLSSGKDDGVCQKADWISSLKRLGWDGGNEKMLFECIDKDDNDFISLPYLRWFTKDKKKHLRKEQAKKHSMKACAKHNRERQEIEEALQQFKTFLKRKYVTILRAWRCAIDLDGSMTVSKHELFQALKKIGWKGDTKLLWKGLEMDNNGVITLAEVDLRIAERLAKFKEFTKTKYGSAVEAFRALDRQNKGKLQEQEFIEACKKEGFSKMNVSLFHGLDWLKNKFVMEKDLAFLDSWRAPPYLTCKANDEAAEEFKAGLRRVFKNYLKAWRACLDRDNSNGVGWQEFEAAAKRIRFTGDLPGAWRALDANVNGIISLHEIDSEASIVISEFKCWTEREFGSARRAFKIFDYDNSLELSKGEWRKACMGFAYQGNSRALFDALDCDGSGVLTINEMAFIDTWELSQAQLSEIYPEGKPPEEEAAPKKVKPDIEMTPRMLKLALPKVNVLINAGNTISIDAAETQDSWSDKSKEKRTLVSPYLPKLHSHLGQSFTKENFFNRCNKNVQAKAVSPTGFPDVSLDPWASARIDTLKGRILNEPIMQAPPEVSLGIEKTDFFDLRNIRQKTLDLRNRTMSLLGKVEHTEQQFNGRSIDRLQRSLNAEDCDQNIEDLMQDVLRSPPNPKQALPRIMGG